MLPWTTGTITHLKTNLESSLEFQTHLYLRKYEKQCEVNF